MPRSSVHVIFVEKFMMRLVNLFVLCCVFVVSGNAAENPEFLRLMEKARAEYLSGNFGVSETFLLAALRALQETEQPQRAATLVDLGDVYVYKEDLPKAVLAYEEALKLYMRLGDDESVTRVLRSVGATYSLQRRDKDAKRSLNEALKLAKKLPMNVALTAEVTNSLGVLYYRTGNNSKAEKLFNNVLEMVSTSGVAFDTGPTLNNLGAVYHAKRDFRKAEHFLKQALEIKEKQLGPAHYDLTIPLATLGIVYTDAGRYREAEDQFLRQLAILHRGGADFETRIARTFYALSGVYYKSGRKAEGNAALAEASGSARRRLMSHPDMGVIVEAYSTVLKNQGKTKEAEELRVEVKRARVSSELVINAYNPWQ
jgi:tetratricopeptide (TPR) repeat protein